MDQPIPNWLRAFLIFVAFQAMLLVLVLVNTDLVKLFVPFAATPLNARFIAALYVSLGAGVLLAAFATRLRTVRLVLIGIGIATGVLFVLTLPHLGELNPFPTFWMLFYLIDPLVVLYAFWRLDWRETVAGKANPLAPVWLVEAAVFGIGGLVLLIVPQVAITLWPWAMTEALSQLYSAFFITIALIAILAARESQREGTRILVFMLCALAVLVLVASVLHLPRFKPGAPTLIWFVFFIVQALAFGAILIRQRARPILKGATA